MAATSRDPDIRRLRDLLTAAFHEVVGISTSPFRRIPRWRVERHLHRRLEVFTALDTFSPEETEQLRPLLVEHERVLSRVDSWRELCAIPTLLPYLLFLASLLTIIPQVSEDLAAHKVGALTLLVPILSYLGFIIAMWRTSRRLLPPPTFDFVGARKYKPQPLPVLGCMVLLFAVGVAGYHIAGWGLRIESDWYYLLLYAGSGLLAGCIVAGLWVVLRLLDTMAEWLLQHVQTFRHPEAFIVDNYLAMLHELHRLDVDDRTLASRAASKRTLLDLIEMSAQCMEEGLRREMKGLDPYTGEWLRDRTAGVATAVRMMKKDVISGDKETQARLFDRLRSDFRYAVLGEWTRLPREAEPAYRGDSPRSLLLRVVVSVVLVGLPLALVLPKALSSDKGDKGKSTEQAETAAEEATEEAVVAPAPPGGAGPQSREAAETIRNGARDWDANLQLIAGILASIILLMSRFDDLASRFSRQRGSAGGAAAEG